MERLLHADLLKLAGQAEQRGLEEGELVMAVQRTNPLLAYKRVIDAVMLGGVALGIKIAIGVAEPQVRSWVTGDTLVTADPRPAPATDPSVLEPTLVAFFESERQELESHPLDGLEGDII